MVNGALCDMLYEYIYLATTYIIMICHVHYCKSTKIYYDIYVKLYRIKLCHQKLLQSITYTREKRSHTQFMILLYILILVNIALWRSQWKSDIYQSDFGSRILCFVIQTYPDFLQLPKSKGERRKGVYQPTFHCHQHFNKPIKLSTVQ